MKKFRCTVCGYVHEGDAAPEKCPLCKAPASKFVEVVEVEGGALSFADEHVIGVAKGCDEEMIKDLNNHFMGECTEVGMYLAMSRQADREGYPEVAEAFKRYVGAHVAEICISTIIGKKLNMLLSLQNCWVTAYGILKLTCRNVKTLNKVHAKTKNASQLVLKL